MLIDDDDSSFTRNKNIHQPISLVLSVSLAASGWLMASVRRGRMYKYEGRRKKAENASLYKILLPNSDMKGLGRTFWLICCLSSAGVCVFQLHDRISYYFETPIMTQVMITQADAGHFPPVTVCPAYFKSGFTSLLRFAMAGECLKHGDCREFADGNIKRLFHYPLDAINFTADLFWEREGINDSLVDIFASCAGLADKKTCDSGKLNVISTVANTVLGRCITYALENEVEFNGASSYLEFRVKIHQSEINTSNEDEENDEIYYFIPPVLSAVAHQAYYASKSLVKNQQTSIVIGSKQFEFLNLKNKPCNDENTVIQCRFQCFSNKFEQMLHCSLPFFNSTILKPCKTGATIKDAYVMAKRIYRSMKHDECKCAQMCKEVVYDSVIDVAPNQGEKINATLFTFYFSDNNNEIIRETHMYTFAALLSDIAGNVGFFLGLSVLRALEVLVYLFSYVTSAYKKKFA